MALDYSRLGKKAETDVKRLQGALQSCSIPLHKATGSPLEVHPSPWKCQYSKLPRAKTVTVEVFEMFVIIAAIEAPPCLVLPHLCTKTGEFSLFFPGNSWLNPKI